MNENEFNQLADNAFAHIERVIDSSGQDIDYDSNGVVMEIEFDNGNKIIVNRHVPNQEIWLAAKSGGFHFAFRQDGWLSQRDDSELFTKLTTLFSEQGSNLHF
jgi:CyaY protein